MRVPNDKTLDLRCPPRLSSLSFCTIVQAVEAQEEREDKHNEEAAEFDTPCSFSSTSYMLSCLVGLWLVWALVESLSVMHVDDFQCRLLIFSPSCLYMCTGGQRPGRKRGHTTRKWLACSRGSRFVVPMNACVFHLSSITKGERSESGNHCSDCSIMWL